MDRSGSLPVCHGQNQCGHWLTVTHFHEPHHSHGLMSEHQLTIQRPMHTIQFFFQRPIIYMTSYVNSYVEKTHLLRPPLGDVRNQPIKRLMAALNSMIPRLSFFGLHYIVLHINMHIFTYESARIHTSYIPVCTPSWGLVLGKNRSKMMTPNL